MTTHLGDELDTQSELVLAQREVQRWLGRCMLRLQQYERLMKVLVTYHELSGPMSALRKIREARVERVAKDSLGQLVGKLVGQFIVNDEVSQPENSVHTMTDSISVSFRVKLSLSAHDYERTKASLKELVDLRNELAHHFIERFDLWSSDGCATALTHLQDAYGRIDERHAELRLWLEQMNAANALALSFIQSDAFTDLIVNGIAPDGNIHWPGSGIVHSLREAAHVLAVNGWTSLDAAVAWIGQHHPDQRPTKYGCRRWRQVLHESRCFEWRYREVQGGAREAWFKPR